MAEYRVAIHRLDEAPSLSTSVPLDFEGFLFNERVHLRSQPSSEGYSLDWIHAAQNRVKARFSIFIHEATGMSPCRAPFGSLEFSPRLPVQALDLFLDQIELFTRTHALQQLQIKSYPFCYAPEQATTLTQRLLQRGFCITQSELNYHLPVTTTPFVSRLHPSKRPRLRKSMQQGVVFAEAPDLDPAIVYAYVKKCRLRRGFPISMTEADFLALFRSFPDSVKVFTVTTPDHIAALTVAIVINKRILYNFYLADEDEYRKGSPAVLLTQGVYQYCQLNGFEVFDLGISTADGIPNPGLMRFKQDMGAQTTLKLSFEKKWKG